ncbi:MAG: BRO-N domain-containing protein [Chitinophagaceae bacterium]
MKYSKKRTINFEEHSLRIFEVNDFLFFSTEDICTILEIEYGQTIISQLKTHESQTIENPKYGNFYHAVNECGLYKLIFRFAQKDTIQFEKWITNEVLPLIRKIGFYSIQNHKLVNQLIKNETIKLSVSKFMSHKGGSYVRKPRAVSPHPQEWFFTQFIFRAKEV